MSAYAFSTTQCVSSKAVRANAATSREQAPSLSPRRRQPRSVGGGGINKHVGHHQRQRRHALIPPSHASTSTYEDITEAEQAAEAVAKASHGAPYDWLAHWYPVALESATPKDRPTAVKLLGKELVLWHDGSAWRCFEDRCPHRAVPLSEGRVETAAAAAGGKGGKNLPKELQCAYHGFQFAFDGACTSVPQAISAKAEQRAKASPRSCATVHPTRHSGDGLLWVWPVAGDFVRAGATPTGQHALLDKAFPEVTAAFGGGKRSETRRSAVVFMSPWFVRDVPLDVDVLAENVVDPSHVFFSVKTRIFFSSTLFCSRRRRPKMRSTFLGEKKTKKNKKKRKNNDSTTASWAAATRRRSSRWSPLLLSPEA